MRRADAQGVDPDHSDWKLYCDRQGIDSTLDADEVHLAQSGQCTPAELRLEKLHRAHKHLKRHEATCLMLQCQRNRRPNYLNCKTKLEHQKWLREREIRHKMRADEAAAKEREPAPVPVTRTSTSTSASTSTSTSTTTRTSTSTRIRTSYSRKY